MPVINAELMEPSNLVGTQLGCYEIQTLLGSGGMAHVYRGLDQNLQRPVAIKVLSRQAAAQPGFAERFRQEARIIAGLHHPHIVQVYNFGQQDGCTYMVQELLPGPTLEQYLDDLAVRDRLLDRQDIISIVSQIASALDVAHAADIVHRDVKPANMLWNAAGALVLTDFGVARHILTESSHIQTGAIIGTPYYLSPEQARGLAGTQASDIYALGVVIYQLVTGKVPFIGNTQSEVLAQHIHTPPPAMHTLRPDVLHAVETVVQRALAKDPAARFASSGELARALRRAWPPAFGRIERESTGDNMHNALRHWRDSHFGTASARGMHGQRDQNISIHSQKTIIALESPVLAAPTSALRPGEEIPLSQHPASSEPAVQSVPDRWQILPLILSTLLVTMIVGATVFQLQRDYQQQAAMAAMPRQVTPTAAPTARLLLTTAIPTPEPTVAAVRPGSTSTDHIATDAGLIAPTTPPEVASVAFTAPHETDTLSQTGQFARLRMLIEAESSDGWARIDRDAWLNRLDEIQRAVEIGDTRQAAVWLDEMRQTLLHNADGAHPPEMVDQMISNIETIAANHNIVLPSLARPVVDDS